MISVSGLERGHGITEKTMHSSFPWFNNWQSTNVQYIISKLYIAPKEFCEQFFFFAGLMSYEIARQTS